MHTLRRGARPVAHIAEGRMGRSELRAVAFGFKDATGLHNRHSEHQDPKDNAKEIDFFHTACKFPLP